MNTNVIVIVGNLVKKIELKTSAQGVEIVRNTIAVNERKANGEEKTSFFDFVCFKGTAKFLNEYCKKGNKILIEGYLTQDRYTNREGKEVSSISIIANKIDLLTQKEKSVDSVEKPVEKPNKYDAFKDDDFNDDEFNEEDLTF